MVRVGLPHETLFQLKFNDNGNPVRIDSPLFGIGLRPGGVYPLHPFLRGKLYLLSTDEATALPASVLKIASQKVIAAKTGGGGSERWLNPAGMLHA